MIVDAALRYARRGVHIFPCRGKVPCTAHGVKDATINLDRIRAWWRLHPDANLAIATGLSALVVVDVDCKHGVDGFETLDGLQRAFGPLPKTATASTPSGGEHRYFQAPDGVELRPSAGKLGRGIDVRAGNSYVIAPPSVISGVPYAWRVKLAPQPLPPRWVKAMRPVERNPGPRPVSCSDPGDGRVVRFCRAALEGRVDDLAKTPAGQRNHALWAAATYLAGLLHYEGFSAEELEQQVEWACSQWEERSPRKDRDTFRRALAWGVEHPIDKWGDRGADAA